MCNIKKKKKGEASWKLDEDDESFLVNLLFVPPIIFTVLEFLWNKYLCTSMEEVLNLLQKCWNTCYALQRQS